MSKKQLFLLTGYYLFCGLSGLFVPVSWYWAAGLSLELPGLLVRITGAVLLAIGIGFWRSIQYPALQPGVVVVAFWANVIDFVAVLIAAVEGELAFAAAGGFLVVDLVWAIVLWRVMPRLLGGRV